MPWISQLICLVLYAVGLGYATDMPQFAHPAADFLTSTTMVLLWTMFNVLNAVALCLMPVVAPCMVLQAHTNCICGYCTPSVGKVAISRSVTSMIATVGVSLLWMADVAALNGSHARVSFGLLLIGYCATWYHLCRVSRTAVSILYGLGTVWCVWSFIVTTNVTIEQ